MTERDEDLPPVEHVFDDDDNTEVEAPSAPEPDDTDDDEPEVEAEPEQADDEPEPEPEPEEPKKEPAVPESVQKRLDKITWQMREYERVAKALAERNKELEEQHQRSQATTAQHYEQNLSTRYEQAKAKKKAAYENGDTDALLAADEEMTTLLSERQRFDAWKQQQAMRAQQAAQQPRQPQPQQPAQPDQKAVAWAGRNEWFGRDKKMTAVAYAIDADLKSQGIDPRSDEYYSRLDKELRETFPSLQGKSPASSMSATTVAPVNRTVTPAGKKGRTVKLSESQIAIARGLGLTNEQYARELLKMERNS